MDNDNIENNKREKELEAKQSYLRKSILEKGYDPELFLSHLTNIKGENGGDLSHWSMAELLLAVKSFTELNGIKVSNDDKEDLNSNSNANANHNNIFDDTQSVISRISKPDISIMNDIDSLALNNTINTNKIKRRQSNEDYEFIEVIQCQKIEYSALSKYNNTTVSISNPIKHPGGVFSKSYLSYEVTTNPNSLTVRRQYSDFKWLRKIMSILYTGSSIPPLPKKLIREKWSNKSIEKSMRAYQKFLQSLIDDPFIKHSPILYDFLSMQKESEFYSRKTYYSKVKSPKSIDKILSLNGKIRLQLSSASESYVDDIKQHIDTADTLLKKFTSLLSTLIVDLNHISGKMKEISDTCLQLYENSHKFEDSESITDIYRVISALMSHWSESEKKQADMLQLHLRENIRFIRKECLSMRELHCKLEERQSVYYKYQDRLTYKKEELFKRGEAYIAKWGLSNEDAKDKAYLMKNKAYALNKMLPKESAVAYANKRYYAYFISQFISEFERIRHNDGMRYKENFMILAKEFDNILSQLNKVWKDMIDFFNKDNLDADSDN